MPAPDTRDPHDPLEPRVPGPWLYRWWRGGLRSARDRPLQLAAAVLLLALVAFVVVILLGSA